MANARSVTESLGEVSSFKEQAFIRTLPPDEGNLNVSNESLGNAVVFDAREQFRTAHQKHSMARSYQAEIENEYFEYPEDFH
ncbi:MAG: hypothetical protein U5N55_03135 [Cypionkella sp.]|nr:hypothetical protein [Cypionkella sp.]